MMSYQYSTIDRRTNILKKPYWMHSIGELLGSGSLNARKSLYDLPDELILETVRHLECIRYPGPRLIANKHWTRKERRRQLDNKKRQWALYSVCLASHRLGRIATPVLYASFTTNFNPTGLQRLKLIHRTILNHDSVAGSGVPVARYLHYIEHRLLEYQDISRHLHVEEHDVVQYFHPLADLISVAVNLQDLCVTGKEGDIMSLWMYIVARHPAVDLPHDRAELPMGIFGKLETICLQIEQSKDMISPETALFASLCATMNSAPMLKSLQASGVRTGNNTPTIPRLSSGQFRQLQRLEITECTLDFGEVLEFWRSCEGLQHIACGWAFLASPNHLPSELLPGLLQHAKTLQTLSLDLRNVQINIPRPPEPPLFGSLQAFVNLRRLTLCERFTSDDHCVWRGRIAALLPTNLEMLTILRHWNGLFEFGSHEDRTRNLRHLAEDCSTSLTQLNQVFIYDCGDFSASELRIMFNDAGVQFDIVQEAE